MSRQEGKIYAHYGRPLRQSLINVNFSSGGMYLVPTIRASAVSDIFSVNFKKEVFSIQLRFSLLGLRL